jgi:hypothetical protein
MFRYILFDSSQHMRFDQRLRQWGVAYRSLFDGYPENAFPEMAPLLIDITAESDTDSEVINEAMRVGQLKPCVSVLSSRQPLSALAKHLGAFHLIETPSGRLMVMRWYDTRILPVWLDTLTPGQRGFFTRDIEQWISLDRFGNEKQHILLSQGDVTPDAEPVPLQLDQQQLDQLFTAAEPDALIVELRTHLRAELKDVPQRELYPFIHDHWQLARKYGINDQDDQIQFLLLALFTSGAFIKNPDFAELLIQLPDRQHSFTELFDALPDSVWRAGSPLWERDIL